MDLSAHVDDITLGGDYCVLMRTIEVLKLEIDLQVTINQWEN